MKLKHITCSLGKELINFNVISIPQVIMYSLKKSLITIKLLFIRVIQTHFFLCYNKLPHLYFFSTHHINILRPSLLFLATKKSKKRVASGKNRPSNKYI